MGGRFLSHGTAASGGDATNQASGMVHAGLPRDSGGGPSSGQDGPFGGFSRGEHGKPTDPAGPGHLDLWDKVFVPLPQATGKSLAFGAPFNHMRVWPIDLSANDS